MGPPPGLPTCEELRHVIEMKVEAGARRCFIEARRGTRPRHLLVLQWPATAGVKSRDSCDVTVNAM